MDKHTRHHNDPQHACIACGHTRPEAVMRPFGRHAGRVVTWACHQCLDAKPATVATPLTRRDAAAVMELA